MQLPFFIRKSKKKKSPTRMLSGDVFFDPKESTLKLKRPSYFITINWSELWGHPNTRFITIAIFAVILFSGVLFSFRSSASVATFTPQTCLGGWEAVENATGLPTLGEDANPLDFHEDNSAKSRGSSEIYCGNFVGEIPKDTSPKTFTVSFRVAVDDGKTKREKSKVIETEEITNTDIVPDVSEEDSSFIEEGQDIINDDSVSNDEPTIEEVIESGEVENIQDATVSETVTEPSSPVDQNEEPAQAEQGAFIKRFIKQAFAQEETFAPEEPSVQEETTAEETPSQEEVSISEEVQSDNIVTEENSSVDTILEEEPHAESVLEENTTTEEDTSNNDEFSNIETEYQEPQTPDDAILVATYTLDGETWKEFGFIRMNSWEKSEFEIPLSDWDDISSVQIKLEPVTRYDEIPTVYLDAIVISVEYDDSAPDILKQPDFRNDIILSDTTVEDIRVIKILRDGVPMIWYTKLQPPTELIEGSPFVSEEINEDDTISEESLETTETIESENNIKVEEPENNDSQTQTNTEGGTQIESLENTNQDETVTNENIFEEQARLINKIVYAFYLPKVLAQDSGSESSGGSGDSSSESSSQGGESSSESPADSSSPSSDSDVESTEENISSESETESNISTEDLPMTDIEQDSVQAERDSQIDFFENIEIPGGGVITVDNVVKDAVSNPDFFDENSLTEEQITTTEEIVPGVIPIVYTEEEIQEEIMKKLEWNFVAMGDVVDITSPVDITGGKIFWLSRDKTAIYEYNTMSGGISSQSISSTQEAEVKYLEPNGDVSEIEIDPVDLIITTPKEEETGLQNLTVPESKSENSSSKDDFETESGLENKEEVVQ